MAKPRHENEPDDAPIPAPDQGDQAPIPDFTREPEKTPKETPPPHPIEAALSAADEAVIKAQGGPPGSGIKALLAILAAQIGVKIA